MRDQRSLKTPVTRDQSPFKMVQQQLVVDPLFRIFSLLLIFLLCKNSLCCCFLSRELYLSLSLLLLLCKNSIFHSFLGILKLLSFNHALAILICLVQNFCSYLVFRDKSWMLILRQTRQRYIFSFFIVPIDFNLTTATTAI